MGSLESLESLQFLQYDFMQRALLAAVLVGVAAPSVGIFLVQRRLALMGDGMGHVALTGVALVTATAGAVIIELLRTRGRTSSDLALALMFYGGIAGGVVLISKAPGGTPASLNQYLFGSITTTTPQDLAIFAALSFAVVAITVTLSRQLFAVANDEEFARASGLPVVALNLVVAVLTAVTVVVAMRVVGLLLVSALMVVPVATAQLVSRSFRQAFVTSLLIGLFCAVIGVAASFYTNTPSGGSIVLVAIALFALTAVFRRSATAFRSRA